MVKQSQLELFKEMANMQVELIASGALYVIVEGNTVAWTVQSQNFNMEVFKEGMVISPSGGAARAIAEKRTIISKLPASIYGKRLIVTSSPIYDDAGENVVGAISIAFPKLHPVVEAFPVFAPVLSTMFPEGVYLYASDLEKIIRHQPSQLFDLPDRHTGYILQEVDVAHKVMNENKAMSFEVDASRYGVPTYITNIPLCDEENKNEVVGSFGLVIPKTTAGKLRGLSHHISESLTQISAAVEQLTASANEIHSNEQVLSDGISMIKASSEEIGQVSVFIKEVANQINMLGLNAAIEAARAGEAGKGFTIVAQEIRKLSEHSKGTAPTISKLTESIQQKSQEIHEYGKKSIYASQEQVAATEEICASIEALVNLSGTLNDMADKA